MTLGEFLASRTAIAGNWNCSTMPADWCVALGYPDFAAKWRGVVDPVDCETVTGGDLLALWEEGIADRLPVATAPYREGDIAVVQLASLQAGAVFTGKRWALQVERGIAAASFGDRSILKAWRPCPRR